MWIVLLLENYPQLNVEGTYGQLGSTKFDSDALVNSRIAKKIILNLIFLLNDDRITIKQNFKRNHESVAFVYP